MVDSDTFQLFVGLSILLGCVKAEKQLLSVTHVSLYARFIGF